MIDCVLVWTTWSADDDASQFAEALVVERLAACVVVQPVMTSVYRWKENVEQDRERQIVIKTTADKVSALQARMRELHPYDLPECLVTPVTGGSPEYLEWVRQSVGDG